MRCRYYEVASSVTYGNPLVDPSYDAQSYSSYAWEAGKNPAGFTTLAALDPSAQTKVVTQNDRAYETFTSKGKYSYNPPPKYDIDEDFALKFNMRNPTMNTFQSCYN